MGRSRRHWIGLRRVAALAIAATAAVFLSGAGVGFRDSAHETTRAYLTDHGPVPAWTSAVVSQRVASGPAYTVRVLVAADQVFAEDFGPQWRADAERLVRSASALMELVDVKLATVDIVTWQSTPPTGGLVDMLAEMMTAIELPGDAVVIGLTSRAIVEYPSYDGWATERAPAALIKVAAPAHESAPTLLAHELGHLLSVDHHEDGHFCPEGGCIMDAAGYSHGDRWCEYHAEDLAAALAAT